MAKPRYLIALGCYLAIPAIGMGGFALGWLIDPEMAHGSADYARDYHLLELVRGAALLAVSGLAFALWVATCYLVITSRGRSVLWLGLAAGGPFGLALIARLADRSPLPGDLHQQLVSKLKPCWRAALEIGVFLSAWVLAYQCVLLKGEVLIRWESTATGTPVETIVERQTASSGMYAFAEALEMLYLFPLLYLLLPVVFNLVGRRFARSAQPMH
jgi:hypothetical protein